MTQPKPHAELDFDAKKNEYVCRGFWSLLGIDTILKNHPRLKPNPTKSTTLNGAEIQLLDSAGALLLVNWKTQLSAEGHTVLFVNFTKAQQALLALIEKKQDDIAYQPVPPKKENPLIRLGKETIYKLLQVDGLIILIGNLTEKLFNAMTSWRHLQVPSIFSNLNSTGVQALPILALLSFLIGVVLAYEMGLQLETYGANIFIAYLSGMACFREFAPLIAAIIVAGRTSSSFTAQIGSMKLNEEVAALETMGLSPVELLVLPKLIALLLVFPLLIFWSDIFSILGAMLMSKIKLDIGYADFLTRLQSSVGTKQMLLGLYKAPAFAVIIALVGCFQGFNVESNASSIGSQTTRSVVQALFLIIIADAAFSIVYSWMHL